MSTEAINMEISVNAAAVALSAAAVALLTTTAPAATPAARRQENRKEMLAHPSLKELAASIADLETNPQNV